VATPVLRASPRRIIGADDGHTSRRPSKKKEKGEEKKPERNKPQAAQAGSLSEAFVSGAAGLQKERERERGNGTR